MEHAGHREFYELVDVPRLPTLGAVADKSLIETLRAEGASSSVLGNLALLDSRLLVLCYSMRCSGSLILRTCDLAEALRDARRSLW